MPTFRHGKNTVVLIDQYDLSVMLREANVTAEADTADTSAFGTFDKTYVVGLIGASASVSGMFSGAVGEIDYLLNAWNGDDIDHVVSILQEGKGAVGPTGMGRKATLMPGKISGRAITNQLTDMVGVSANIISNGATRQGVTLHDYADPETSSGPGSGIDNGVSTTFGAIGHLHVIANTRDGNSTLKVQHSPDDSTQADLITFAVIPAGTVGSQRIVLPNGTFVNRYMQGRWILSGTTGAITFAITCARLTF